MRTSYKCRTYPDETQQLMLNRTFGCVRVVWNRTLASRQARWHRDRKGTSYAETDRALTQMKKIPDLEFLNEVSAVPLQAGLAAGAGNGADACGAGVRHSEKPPVRSAMKQES